MDLYVDMFVWAFFLGRASAFRCTQQQKVKVQRGEQPRCTLNQHILDTFQSLVFPEIAAPFDLQRWCLEAWHSTDH